MSTSPDHLNSARKRLVEALGSEKKQKYFHHMKQWFRMKVRIFLSSFVSRWFYIVLMWNYLFRLVLMVYKCNTCLQNVKYCYVVCVKILICLNTIHCNSSSLLCINSHINDFHYSRYLWYGTINVFMSEIKSMSDL